MADELNDSAASDILASIQIIQNNYPSVYQLAREQLILTGERTNQKTVILPLVAVKNAPVIPPPSQTLTSKEPQTKSGLIVGFCIVSAILGGVVVNSFNKSPNPANTPQPTSTDVRASSIGNNNSALSSTVTTLQTRLSPAQAIRNHYQVLNTRNYDLAWDNLTSHFKSESGKSFTLSRKEYEDWGNSVRSIDLQRAETSSISIDGNMAVVNYRLGYTMNSGRFVQDQHTQLFLVWDEGKAKWLIDRRS